MNKSIEQWRIDHAKEFPYNNRPAADRFELAAQAVLADLGDRSGIDHALGDIDGDEEVTEEIVTSLAAVIKAVMESDHE